MGTFRQSDSFKYNFFFWKMFALWPGRTLSIGYKYFSIIYLMITFIIYNILLTVNLYYTPRTIEALIREVIFLFTEIAITAKILMIIFKRKLIIKVFDMLDSEVFLGEGGEDTELIKKYNSYYKIYWKFYMIISNTAYSSQVFLPLVSTAIFGSKLELPICKYYFLSDEIRQKYFGFWYAYQSAAMYGHMTYNVNVDSFIAGLIILGIAQFKAINHKLVNLNSKSRNKGILRGYEEIYMKEKLRSYLVHYDLLLIYCKNLQTIFNFTMFVQFGAAMAIICVVLTGLLLPWPIETYLFLVLYLNAMTLQIFLPGWLGTQLTYESQELAMAAYKSGWLRRSESFKRSLRLLVQRANTPVVLTGAKIFPLSLGTFTSIMKSAYSFFTLLRNFQARQDDKF